MKTEELTVAQLLNMASSLRDALHRVEQELRGRGVDREYCYITGTHPAEYDCEVCGTPHT